MLFLTNLSSVRGHVDKIDDELDPVDFTHYCLCRSHGPLERDEPDERDECDEQSGVDGEETRRDLACDSLGWHECALQRSNIKTVA